jgi:hypothetical protein
MNDEPMPSPDPKFTDLYYPCAKVVVKEAVTIKDADGVLYPTCHCGIITTNGQLWLVSLSAFIATAEFVQKLWATQPSMFFQRQQP